MVRNTIQTRKAYITSYQIDHSFQKCSHESPDVMCVLWCCLDVRKMFQPCDSP